MMTAKSKEYKRWKMALQMYLGNLRGLTWPPPNRQHTRQLLRPYVMEWGFRRQHLFGSLLNET